VSLNGVTNLWSNIVYRINEYTYNFQDGYQEPPRNPFIPPNEPIVTSQPVIPPTDAPTTTPPRTASVKESCGVANDIQTLVLKGEKTIENEYPWLVAMFRRHGVSYEFQCTANLISDRHVVTGNTNLCLLFCYALVARSYNKLLLLNSRPLRVVLQGPLDRQGRHPVRPGPLGHLPLGLHRRHHPHRPQSHPSPQLQARLGPLRRRHHQTERRSSVQAHDQTYLLVGRGHRPQTHRVDSGGRGRLGQERGGSLGGGQTAENLHAGGGSRHLLEVAPRLQEPDVGDDVLCGEQRREWTL
jgi:hypothetical protein